MASGDNGGRSSIAASDEENFDDDDADESLVIAEEEEEEEEAEDKEAGGLVLPGVVDGGSGLDSAPPALFRANTSKNKLESLRGESGWRASCN